VSFDILHPGFQRLPTRKRVVDQKFTEVSQLLGSALQERQRYEGRGQKERSIDKNFSCG
jgi:hypothetical protein